MTTGPGSPKGWLSAVCCGVAVAVVSGAGFWVPIDRGRFFAVFKAYGAPLSDAAFALYRIPDAAFPGAGLAAAALLVGLQLRVKREATAVAVHLSAAVGALLAYVLYRELMVLMVFKLFRGLGGAELRNLL